MELQTIELQTIENLDIIVNYQESLIDFDNTKIVTLAKELVKKYESLIVTEDMVKDISSEVAGINKVIKKINDKRISIKNDYSKPLIIFESKINVATTILSNTVKELKKQLQVYEDERKSKKMIDISALIDLLSNKYNLKTEYANKVILKDSYLNKTTTMQEIELSLTEQIDVLYSAQSFEEQKAKHEAERIERAIKEKHELIFDLNTQYGFNFSLSTFNNMKNSEILSYFINKKAELNKPIINKEVEIKSNEEVNDTITYELIIKGLTKYQADNIIGMLPFECVHKINVEF